MAKKRDARRDASLAKPKQLRKRLRKAEDQLEDARAKRDRAQARLDALAIIADEIRAQLAELGEADDVPADGPVDTGEQPAEATAAEPASEASAEKKPAEPKAKAKSRTAGATPKAAKPTPKAAKPTPSGAETSADASSPEASVAGEAASRSA
jgi:hypothetical protein